MLGIAEPAVVDGHIWSKADAQFDPELIEILKKVLEDTRLECPRNINPGSKSIFCRVYFESGSPRANQLRRADGCGGLRSRCLYLVQLEPLHSTAESAKKQSKPHSARSSEPIRRPASRRCVQGATERCKTVRVDLGADHLGHDRQRFRDRHRARDTAGRRSSASKISAVVMIRVSRQIWSRREAARIALAVEPLVMRAGDRREFAEGADARQDRLAYARHGCASRPIRASSSLPGLSRMALLTPSLPMSCSSAARLQPASLRGAEPQLLGDHVGEQRRRAR